MKRTTNDEKPLLTAKEYAKGHFTENTENIGKLRRAPIELDPIFTSEPKLPHSIYLCAKRIIADLDHIAEIDISNIDPNLKYELIQSVVDELKNSCDSILKCLDVELKKG